MKTAKFKVKVTTTTVSKPLDKVGAAAAAKSIRSNLRARGVKNAIISIVKA